MALHPIDTAARDGSRVFVTDGATVATARWSGGAGGMWAYDVPGTVQQIDFEPSEWCDEPADFLTGATQ